MTRLAVMAHWDPRGELGPHVRRQVTALAESVDDLVIVSTADLTDSARSWLTGRGRLIERDNVGYDFFSYKSGLDSVSDLAAYDEVVMCNDTYVGPLVSYSGMFAEMADQAVDFWGLTSSQRISPHVQSFFVAFRPWVVGSSAFRTFWGEMTPVSDRQQVIRRFEVGMSTTLTDAGFVWSSYFRENQHDVQLARRRVAWWSAHMPTIPRTREGLAAWNRHRKVHWNPAAGLADRALGEARLPYVKIDTLRYDPYGLGADKLLRLCEQDHPDAFDGVRDYLEQTASLSAVRPDAQLQRTPTILRPLRPFVEYRRGA